MKIIGVILLSLLICLIIDCSFVPKFHTGDKVQITGGRYKYCSGVIVAYRDLWPNVLVDVNCNNTLFAREYYNEVFLIKEDN